MKRIILFLCCIFFMGNHCEKHRPAFRSRPVPLGDFFQDYWQQINLPSWSYINDIKVSRSILYITQNNKILKYNGDWQDVVSVESGIKDFEISKVNPDWILIRNNNSVLYIKQSGISVDSLFDRVASFHFSIFDLQTFYFIRNGNLIVSYNAGISSSTLFGAGGIKDFTLDIVNPSSIYFIRDSFGTTYLYYSNDSGKIWMINPTPENFNNLLVDSNRIYGITDNGIWDTDKNTIQWQKINNDYISAIAPNQIGFVSILFRNSMAECWKKTTDWANITIGIDAIGNIEDIKLSCDENFYFLYLYLHRIGNYLCYFADTDKEP